MSVAHETVVFDVNDCHVYPMLTDPKGASPTYGPGVDVPGISELGMNPNIVSQELKGDARVIAKKGRTDRMAFSVGYSKIALDAMAVILSGTVSDSGTTPNEEARWRLKSPASLPYFKLEALIEDVDLGIGDLTVVLYKCQVSGGKLIGQATDSFGKPSFDGDAIAIEGTIDTDQGVMVDIVLHETLTNLP